MTSKELANLDFLIWVLKELNSGQNEVVRRMREDFDLLEEQSDSIKDDMRREK